MSRTNKTRRLTIESLETRRLMAADAFANGGQIYGPLPADTAPAAMSFTFFPDNVINTSLVANEFEPGKNQLVIDGSDADDRITILKYTPGATNDVVRVQLSRWDGNTLLSTVTRDISCGKLGNAVAAIRVVGGNGNDEITNNTSLRMAASGGNGSDTIQAGSAGDSISGGAGRNYLYGGIGPDLIHGGDERDIITGGEGIDILYGNGGPDDIWGDYSLNDSRYAFKDYIYGGAGDDTLWGGAGDDRIEGNDGRDTIFAGYGNDEVWGGYGNDTIYGQQGRDTLFGEADTDTVDGGADDDYKIDGGFGTSTNLNVVTADTLIGGTGRDKFVRHSSAFSFNEGDALVDFNEALGDTVETFYHW